MQCNIHEAKSNLSKLVELAEQGEEVVIARAGKPAVKLVRVAANKKSVLGSAAGQIKFKPGWDAPMNDKELEEFIGG